MQEEVEAEAAGIVEEETTKVELVEKKGEDEEDTGEVIVPQYEVSHPLLLEALLAASDILEGVTEGTISLDEAARLYKERVAARIAELAKPVKEKRQARAKKKAKVAAKAKKKAKKKK
ncbi:MAG: hypothetical protein F7C07_03270 [Desulfurococcales archaeon]|nr:hypothetical protein [Desulfurococcales archaeon]